MNADRQRVIDALQAEINRLGPDSYKSYALAYAVGFIRALPSGDETSRKEVSS